MFNLGAQLSLRENRHFTYRVGTVPVEHMKLVLRGVTRLLRDYKFQIDSVFRKWSYRLQVCNRHGDCGRKLLGRSITENCEHLAGHLFDLLELQKLVKACPGFRLQREGHPPEDDECHFTVIVR